MLQRVTCDGIKLPRLYIAEDNADVEVAKANGIPFVKWKLGRDELLKVLLRPILEKKIPGIDWNAVLGRRRRFKSVVVLTSGYENDNDAAIGNYDQTKMLESQLDYKVEPSKSSYDKEYSRTVDIAESTRQFNNGYLDGDYNQFGIELVDLADQIGDINSNVDIEVLARLKLLPQFIGNLYDCVTKNYANAVYWTEGYTKKLGVPLGKFNVAKNLPVLIIIDVSHSIPDGIAATMLILADTLRHYCNAELIITSLRSGYYSITDELPDPNTLRAYYGRNNEAVEFMSILEKHIAGREFGHVISFGDNDCPGSIDCFYDWNSYNNDKMSIIMANTKVHQIHHYHTWQANTPTGYAKWAEEVSPDALVTYDTSWCKVMNKDYELK